MESACLKVSPLILEEVTWRQGCVAGQDPVLLQGSSLLEHLTAHMAFFLSCLHGEMEEKETIANIENNDKNTIIEIIVSY